MTTPTAALLASVDLTCCDLDAAVRSLLALGFRMDRISPADHPVEADVSGNGVRLRVRVVDPMRLVPALLRIESSQPAPDVGPDWPTNWTLVAEPVRCEDAGRSMVLPAMVDELVFSRSAVAEFGVGRAGMRYRDLIPSRHGGRYIASHIHIFDGGPVPDYPHYHRVAFQLIFCARGWVRLVYEDQGDPFVMSAGDAVLQPPEIRHRVLESSDGLEVIEIGCPAEHDTFAEHDFGLPTDRLAPQRSFSGQTFVHHRAADATYEPWRLDGFEARDSGIGVATDGVADVRVVRCVSGAGASRGGASGGGGSGRIDQVDDFCFYFVLDGATSYVDDSVEVELVAGDSVSVPRGARFALASRPGLELLEVSVH